MLRVAKIFQDNMMLQRGEGTKVYGTGEKGKTVSVTIQGVTGSAQVQEDGTWQVSLPQLEASSDECLVITDQTEEIQRKHVAIGEIWIGGGQSNMKFWLRYEKHRKDGSSVCENPDIRFYDIPEIAYDGQEEEFDYHNVGVWRIAREEDLDYFSAVGYYFAKNLQETLQIPVAVIGCNWGGTTSSVWMSRETLSKVGQPWIDDFKEQMQGKDMNIYWKEQHNNPINDTGNAQWSPYNELTLPGTPTMEEIGEAMKKMMAQAAPQGSEAKSAKADKMDFASAMAAYRQNVAVQTHPGCLYEHMVKALAPFIARGVLWYQGESDDAPGRQLLYRDMLTGLIGDWRSLWGNGNMPFLIVQLPGYLRWMQQKQLDYATIRRQQELVCDSVADTYLCSIADVGEQYDIHPKDKKTVGERLSLLARRYIYGEKILADAPKVSSIKKQNQDIHICFANVGAGLNLEEDKLDILELEMDGEKLAYTLSLEGDTLHLHTTEELKSPVTVSFAQGKWYQIHLYNSAHIPAIPFRKVC